LLGAEPEGSGAERAARPTIPNGDQFKVWTFHFRVIKLRCCNLCCEVTFVVVVPKILVIKDNVQKPMHNILKFSIFSGINVLVDLIPLLIEF
jgi:hypothetical protein